MTEPSRTPSMRMVKANDMRMARLTSVISTYTFTLPNSLLQRRAIYFTNPSALIMAALGFISNTTPID